MLLNQSQPALTYDGERLRVYYDFLNNPSIIDSVLATWPEYTSDNWHLYMTKSQYKYATRSRADATLAAKLILDDIALNFLGAPGAFPDVELYGAGMHELPANGYLRPHIDALKHPLKGWRRRYSGVLCLEDGDKPNEGIFQYRDRFGGIVEVFPLKNTFTVFECTDTSLHCVTPTSKRRRTLCLFWWNTEPFSDAEAVNYSSVFEDANTLQDIIK